MQLGTMTSDIAGAVRQAKMGQVEFRADKTAIVHAPVGKVSFDDVKLLENVQSLITTMMAAKPKTLKGSAAGTGFIKKVRSSRSSVREGEPFRKMPFGWTAVVAAEYLHIR